MSLISQILGGADNWATPQRVEGNPFRLAWHVSPPATLDEIEAAWPGLSLPQELTDLWLVCRDAQLYVDVDYGQWGLRLLSPAASSAMSTRARSERPIDFDPGDAVIGEFLGDQDLLVVDRDGGVLVALPLDPRDDWYRPAQNLLDFLTRYVAATGAKFWEQGA